MNAAASSLIDAIKASFGGVPTGTDWDLIPSGGTSWFKYGSGGINGWGSLCGVPNGCIAVLNLMNWHSSFAEQIMYYACQAVFPISLDDLYVADPTGWAHQPVPDAEVLAHTVANSPLCHVSVSKWAYAAGVDMGATNSYGSAHKTDRCAKVAAAVAAFTADLINGASSSLAMPDLTADCYSCHKTSTFDGFPAQQGKMDCGECHTDFRPHNGVSLIIEDVWTADGSGNATNNFTDRDQIQCRVQFTILGSGSCYVKTYQSKAKGACGKFLQLSKAETLMAGTYEWMWSGTVPDGCAGVAKVVMDLQMFDYNGGSLHAEAKKTHKFTIT
jgi:hypothetical protein